MNSEYSREGLQPLENWQFNPILILVPPEKPPSTLKTAGEE